jgi:protoheme IX farnesyltransferase
MTTSEKVKAYYSLTKPGVLYGNVITAVAGFLFAAKGHISWILFISAISGIALVIASACVINNYFDQDIDKIMVRTKKRAIVAGLVPAKKAAIFGIVLGIIGLLILATHTSWLVVALALLGFFDYVFLYGMWSKRKSMHGTLVGSVSGAVPILVGYCAAAHTFDLGAFLVFAVLFVWQMPEFYSIAIYRQKEYKAAGVPVITVVKGIGYTKRQVLAYTIAFVIFSLLLACAGAGLVYFIALLLIDIYWIWLGVKGLHARDNDEWARKMFHFSLNALMVFSILISLNAWLP